MHVHVRVRLRVRVRSCVVQQIDTHKLQSRSARAVACEPSQPLAECRRLGGIMRTSYWFTPRPTPSFPTPCSSLPQNSFPRIRLLDERTARAIFEIEMGSTAAAVASATVINVRRPSAPIHIVFSRSALHAMCAEADTYIRLMPQPSVRALLRLTMRVRADHCCVLACDRALANAALHYSGV